jgi:hypothetical protein
MAGISTFQLQNEISPILLQDGIAQGLPDGVMAITDLTEPGGTGGFTYSDYFAIFKNLPNSTLADWQIAEYPFASLVMAANAVIQMPLKISMVMICPIQNEPGRNYFAKTSILTALKTQLQTHVLMGGTFTVVTPAYTYTDLLLRQIRDTSSPSDKQVQFSYQWDFEQPLITESGASQVLGTFAGKVEAGLPTPTSWNQQP